MHDDQREAAITATLDGTITYKTRGAAERAVTMKARGIDSDWHSLVRLQDDGRWSAHVGTGRRGCYLCRMLIRITDLS